MSPANCPRYDSCSAPICPMDPQWRQRNMLKDEHVCTFIRQADRGEQVPVSLDVVKAQMAAHPYIANKLRKEAARREREAIPHPISEVIERPATPLPPRPINPVYTPRLPGVHPTNPSDAREAAA